MRGDALGPISFRILNDSIHSNGLTSNSVSLLSNRSGQNRKASALSWVSCASITTIGYYDVKHFARTVAFAAAVFCCKKTRRIMERSNIRPIKVLMRFSSPSQKVRILSFALHYQSASYIVASAIIKFENAWTDIRKEDFSPGRSPSEPTA